MQNFRKTIQKSAYTFCELIILVCMRNSSLVFLTYLEWTSKALIFGKASLVSGPAKLAGQLQLV